MFEKIKRVLANPRPYIDKLLVIYLSPLFSDRLYIKILSKWRCGYTYNLDNPKTFNEKLNWLKLYDRNPMYTMMADKYQVKKFVAERIGEEYVAKLYGVWESVSDIDWEILPEKCMLKSNADACGRFVYNKGESVNIECVKKKLESAYPFNYYYQSREWPYKNIKRKIIAEEYIDNEGNKIIDYKFWCFNGVPKIVYVTCKEGEVFENFYDEKFHPIMINHGHPRCLPEFTCPPNFELMKSLAAKLSAGIPFVRCDFMLVKGKIWFGECTFFDWGGFRPFGEGWDEKLGEYIKLPNEKC